VKVRVRLFGSLREQAGQAMLDLVLEPGATAADLRDRLALDYPLVGTLGQRLAVSINLEHASYDDALSEGDEVALLPPVAGGSGGPQQCTISDSALDESEVARRVMGDDAGGLVTFVGAVRDHSRGHSIKFLEYEAYPEMAEREMQKIADEAAERWPGTRVAIAHRIGHLEIGDAAVVIAAASPHRAAAFEACRFAIDTLKQTVPIWKKEVATDGEYWVDDHA
jgi:molybdopterin synthase catalytic subunit/molybdopterin converting factor small subunit